MEAEQFITSSQEVINTRKRSQRKVGMNKRGEIEKARRERTNGGIEAKERKRETEKLKNRCGTEEVIRQLWNRKREERGKEMHRYEKRSM